jgi:hypothetical protein
LLDWSLPGRQDHYFKTISELAGEKVMELSKKFDTNFPGEIHNDAGVSYCL